MLEGGVCGVLREINLSLHWPSLLMGWDHTARIQPPGLSWKKRIQIREGAIRI
jgi:hypothetical protein